MSVHQLQHRITSTLQRNMVVRHKGTAPCTIVYQFVAQQIGFQRTDPIAANTLHPVQSFYQINKLFACSLTEVADIHTRQHYFLATFPGCFLSLLYQRGNSRITAKPTGIRYGTISTEIVTTILHLQEITRPVSPRARWRKGLDVLRLLGFVCRDIIATYKSLRKKLDKVRLLIRTQHQIYTLNLADAHGFQLGVAPCHYDKRSRILTHQPMNGLTTLMVSHLRHRTSINQTDVSLFTLLGRLDTQLTEHFAKGGGF